MIIKNRKLIRRDDLGNIADYIDLDRLKADAEAAMLEVDDEAWEENANHANGVNKLFRWSDTPQGYEFWCLVNQFFTVEPLSADTVRLAEIDGEIARLKAEREKLAKEEGCGVELLEA